MKLSKWGNSLGIRIPADMIRHESLKEGDEIEARFKSGGVLELSRNLAKQEALEAVRKLRRPMPPSFKFNREEEHERGSYRQDLRTGS